MQRVLIVLLASAAAWSCAGKRPDAARQAAALRSQAEAKVLAGCYDCLLEARDIYAGLAMDASVTMQRARDLAREMSPPAGAGRLLSLVEGVPPDGTGVSTADDIAFRRSRAEFIARVDEELAWLAADGPLGGGGFLSE